MNLNKIEDRLKKKKQEKEVQDQINFKTNKNLKDKCVEILKERGITLTEYLEASMEVLVESKK